MSRTPAAISILSLACLAFTTGSAATGREPNQRVEFRRAVVNFEYAVFDLKPSSPSAVRTSERPSGLYLGRIMRRLSGDDVHTDSNYVDFAAQFEAGVA